MIIDQITDLIGISNGGLSALEKAHGLFQKTRGLTPASKVDGVDANLLIAELAEKLMEARMAQLQITHRLAELENAVKTADRFDKLLARYAPVRLSGGGFVLQLKEEHIGSEPAHEICPRCVENRQRHFLQPHGRLLECPNCKTTFEKDPDPGHPGRVGPRGGAIF